MRNRSLLWRAALVSQLLYMVTLVLPAASVSAATLANTGYGSSCAVELEGNGSGLSRTFNAGQGPTINFACYMTTSMAGAFPTDFPALLALSQGHTNNGSATVGSAGSGLTCSTTAAVTIDVTLVNVSWRVFQWDASVISLPNGSAYVRGQYRLLDNVGADATVTNSMTCFGMSHGGSMRRMVNPESIVPWGSLCGATLSWDDDWDEGDDCYPTPPDSFGEEYVPPPSNPCEVVRDEWSEYDDSLVGFATLDALDVETVRLTRESADVPWSDMRFRFSALLPSPLYFGSGTTVAEAYEIYESAGFTAEELRVLDYRWPVLYDEVSPLILDISFQSWRDGLPIEWLNVWCEDPSDVEPFFLFRNDSSSTSTSWTPVQRPCSLLEVRFPPSAALSVPVSRVTLEFVDEMGLGGGVLGLRLYRHSMSGVANAVPSAWEDTSGGDLEDFDFPVMAGDTVRGVFDFTGTVADVATAWGPLDCIDAAGVVRFEPPAGGGTGGTVYGPALPPGGAMGDPVPIPVEGGSGPVGPGGSTGGTGTGTAGPGSGGDGGGNGVGVGTKSCSADTGMSLSSPTSWIRGVGRMFVCILQALFIPRSDVIEFHVEGFMTEAEEHVPASWIVAGADMTAELFGGIGESIDASTGECVQWLPEGAMFPEGGEFCPSEQLAGTGWAPYRVWLGRAVWIFFGLWLLATAWALVEGGRTPRTEVFYFYD